MLLVAPSAAFKCTLQQKVFPALFIRFKVHTLLDSCTIKTSSKAVSIISRRFLVKQWHCVSATFILCRPPSELKRKERAGWSGRRDLAEMPLVPVKARPCACTAMAAGDGGANWRLERVGDHPLGSSCLSSSQRESLLQGGIPVSKPAFQSIKLTSSLTTCILPFLNFFFRSCLSLRSAWLNPLLLML